VDVFCGGDMSIFSPIQLFYQQDAFFLFGIWMEASEGKKQGKGFKDLSLFGSCRGVESASGRFGCSRFHFAPFTFKYSLQKPAKGS